MAFMYHLLLEDSFKVRMYKDFSYLPKKKRMYKDFIILGILGIINSENNF